MGIEYKRLGKHGVLVSNICLGTMNFGWHTSEEDSFKIMDKALESGINFFDTADVYGWDTDHGYTEEILGKWFSQGGGRRESVVLATKVYNPANRKSERPEPNHDGTNLSAMKIRRHCEGSLKRLKTDVIDLYQIHHIDRDCPWDEILHAFDNLQKQGKIIYLGSSNFAGWDIATACQEAQKRGLTRLVSEQSVYNLDNRMVELEVIPACQHYGLGLIPYSPVAGGVLAGALKKVKSGRRTGEWVTAGMNDAKLAQVAKYEELCARIGEKPAVVAVAWLFHQPAVTAPIIG
ncbi:MAG: aldo/keto reductase, partial [Spirochaetales bacterium]|nr:aldo/keto reductase [Spirochaetales bacterium]